MTDDAEVVGDLAARVLAAIDETEQNRWRVHDQECDFGGHTTDITDLTVPSAVCDCSEPDRIARRCAADRETVGQYIDADSECKRYMAIEKDEAQPLVERHRASISRDMWGAVAGALFGVLQRLAVVYMITSEVTDHG